MIVLFDQSAKLERCRSAPGTRPNGCWATSPGTPTIRRRSIRIGDLFKTQVWELARHLGVPAPLIEKAPSADLEANQTDEGDLGITYALADHILSLILLGYDDAQIVSRGFSLGRRAAGARQGRRDALEAASAHDRDALEYGDQRVLLAARRLLR